MKLLGITQRVEEVKSYSERRDCLDQRWYEYANMLGYIPVPLPNIPQNQVAALLNVLNLNAVLFSGGNSIASYNSAARDSAPERDGFEARLLDECLARNIPVIGVCRGMQMINVCLGGGLSPISNHVGIRHDISITETGNTRNVSVNSYHNWCIPGESLAPILNVIAVDCAGNVEAFKHANKSVLGIMWHPEREEQPSSSDINLIKSIFI
ncbi:MAG: hypothetical protein OFPI_27410 [Osedax symbiont Rs2]|nr:MAG: hypothetical protein OFPI_27410 [Osedax symbiont Rs2]